MKSEAERTSSAPRNYIGDGTTLDIYASTSSITLCELFHNALGVTPIPASGLRPVLADLYRAATSAVAPGPALEARLERLDPAGGVRILALGKAALPMAEAALDVLRRRNSVPLGGIIVSPAEAAAPDPRLPHVTGDHPEPGHRSLAASDALALAAAEVRPEDEVWVLLSGGTTSLVGAPVEGIRSSELTSLYGLLLGSGLDITAMNRVRKRFSRWGGGRLAQALAPAQVRVFIVSDVIGDDLASIGSGPCVPDPATAGEVRRLLERAGLWTRVPETARRQVMAAEAGEVPETPKPGDQAFARVTLELIASNRLALEAAAARAAELGFAPQVVDTPLAGEAAEAGARVAAALLQYCGRPNIPQPEAHRGRCVIWGGETTVTLGPAPAGLGGRCQELALAAARSLAGGPSGLALLAAGTDGRDGPTDAAGAIVDGATWASIRAAGRSPDADLAGHDAYHALDAAGALFRTGLTGTNVMDVVIGVMESG
jgi:hydroxypyruvate reductase